MPSLKPSYLAPSPRGQGLQHQCIETIEQIYSSRPDLHDRPLDNPVVEWFTEGNSFIEKGVWKADSEIVSLNEVSETKFLPSQTSVQNAE